MPDYKSVLQWLVDHVREYAGQWVALDGACLIAHGAAWRLFRNEHAKDLGMPVEEGVYLLIGDSRECGAAWNRFGSQRRPALSAIAISSS